MILVQPHFSTDVKKYNVLRPEQNITTLSFLVFGKITNSQKGSLDLKSKNQSTMTYYTRTYQSSIKRTNNCS